MFCNSGCCQQMFNFVKTVFVAFIVKSTTFGPLVHLAAHWHSDEIFIDVHENYQKRSLRNKYKISGPNGTITLSIPLEKGKHQQQNIRDVKISYDQPWPRLHKETLRSCYGSAPFFEHYADSLFPLFDKHKSFLFDFNLTTFEWMCKALKKPLLWKPSDTFVKNEILPTLENKPYPQIFMSKLGFVPELSSLDLIMNMGPQSPQFLSIITEN